MANQRKSRRAFLGFSERPSGGPQNGRKRGNGHKGGGHNGKDGGRNGNGRNGGGRGRNGNGSGGRRGRGGGSWTWRLARWSLVVAIWGSVALGGLVAWYAYDLPELKSIPELARRPSVTLLAADGTEFAHYGDTAGPPIKVSEMPRYLPQAVLAIEDRRFYSHPGIDIFGLLRALVTNIVSGELRQGGSTITQQLAKNVFLSNERTMKRKIQELIVAFWLEHKFTKDQILSLYLNRVYLGAGTFGVSAAAERYFDKPVSQLKLNEAAMLAGLLRAPSRYAPTRDLALSMQRTRVVIDAMEDAGYINAAQARTAKAEPIALARPADNIGRYFADWAIDQVGGYIGNVTRDIIVKTTLDIKVERAAERKLRQTIEGPGAKVDVTQGAAVVMATDGAVRAMVGGADYGDSQFNRAVRAMRQPGSAFKPFVYIAALDAGYTPDQVLIDEPVQVGDFRPRNFEGKYRGAVTMEQALAHSINTVAVRVLNQVGVDKVIQWAKRLGITSPLRREAGLALGSSEVTLLELTAAYGTFANHGAGVWPYGVTEVTDSTGKVIYRRLGSGPSLRIDGKLVAEMNRMLSAVVQYGTGRAANTGRPVAGKTGTTDDYRDAWFIGYSANNIAGVWLGNDDHSPMKRVTGGGLPARIWHDIMVAADDGEPPQPLIAQAQQPERRSAPVQSFLNNLFSSVFGGGNRGSASSGGTSRNTGSRSSSFESQVERRDSQRD
jgi:penicillin-binding protein 1A